jgi:Zn2+/Cd2+-exporting ATPase
LFVLSYVAGGYFAAIDVWELLQKRRLDIHFLMLAVAVGSASIGGWGEGATLLFLFSLSGALEHYAMGRTQREIRSLFKSAPKFATLLDASGQQTEMAVNDLRPGMRVLVKPDNQIPVDAEIIRGETACDESNLTGESTAVEKGPGDAVLAGTMNLWGAVEATVLRPASESALQKIIRLIREAQHLKAPAQRFTDKFGSGYTYSILGGSFVMFLVWWLGFGLPPFTSTSGVHSAFYRAMTLLVVASPCALVLSIPSAVLAAIASGARHGILFRGGAAVEKLAEVNVVALDKTGTLTTGDLHVERIESFPAGRETEIAQLAWSLERLSNHPLARAITRYGKRQQLTPLTIEQFESTPGHGLEGRHAERDIKLGHRRWVHVPDAILAQTPPTDAGASEVWIHAGDCYGRIILRETIRAQTRSVLAQLREAGLRSVVLTGDRRSVAEQLQRTLELDDVRAELNPAQKVEIIRSLTADNNRVAMIGDGVNDAPSLAAAHVGVAMGARGSDAALEQAEVILMHDRLENFWAAYQLSKRARQVIRQNLRISLGTVVVLVICAMFGVIPLTVGVIGHEGSTVVVVLNSLRLLLRQSDNRHE